MRLDSLPPAIIKSIAHELIWCHEVPKCKVQLDIWNPIDHVTSLVNLANTCRRLKQILEPIIYKVYATNKWSLEPGLANRDPFKDYYYSLQSPDPYSFMYSYYGPPIF